MKLRKIAKYGFFIQDCCKEEHFYSSKGLIPGQEYEILDKVDTFFGIHFIVKVNDNKEKVVPESCIVLSTNQVFIAKSKGKLNLYLENAIKVLKITKTKTTTSTRTIFPVFIEQITAKLCKVICSHGDVYYVMDRSVTTKPYGYIGRSFDKLPEVGNSFKFKSVVPFIWHSGKTRWWETWINIHRIYSIEVIGNCFFKVKGEVMHRIGSGYGYGYIIVAYISF